MLFEVVMMCIVPLQEDIIKTQLIGYNKCCCCCLSKYIRWCVCIVCLFIIIMRRVLDGEECIMKGCDDVYNTIPGGYY